MSTLAYPDDAKSVDFRVEVAAVVRRALPTLAFDAQIPADVPLTRLGLSSLGSVSLMMAIEDHFKIVVPDADLRPENFRNLGAIQALVARLLDA